MAISASGKWKYSEDTKWYYVEEWCSCCDMVTQFDIETGLCVWCGSNNPFGVLEAANTMDEPTYEEWDKYIQENKKSCGVCNIFPNIEISRLDKQMSQLHIAYICHHFNIKSPHLFPPSH